MASRIRSRLTYPHVVSTVALIVALGTGGAYAANTVFSSDIVDGEVKEADIGTAAVREGEIGQGAVAASELKADAVTNAKVLNETLVGADVKDNALKGVDIDESTLSGIGGGAAGGDLTGTYPNPLIAPDAVGGDELAGINIFEYEKTGIDDSTAPGPTTAVLFEPFGNRRLTAVCEETAGGVVRAAITYSGTGFTSDVDSTAENGADSATAVASGEEVTLVQVGPTTFRATAAGSYAAFATGSASTNALTGEVAALTHNGLDDCLFVASGQME